MYANNVKNIYFSGLGFFFNTGIKKVWIENAPPIAAAKLIYPVPNGFHALLPPGEVAITQTKKITYPIILIIPYAMILAPN